MVRLQVGECISRVYVEQRVVASSGIAMWISPFKALIPRDQGHLIFISEVCCLMYCCGSPNSFSTHREVDVDIPLCKWSSPDQTSSQGQAAAMPCNRTVEGKSDPPRLTHQACLGRCPLSSSGQRLQDRMQYVFADRRPFPAQADHAC